MHVGPYTGRDCGVAVAVGPLKPIVLSGSPLCMRLCGAGPWGPAQMTLPYIATSHTNYL